MLSVRVYGPPNSRYNARDLNTWDEHVIDKHVPTVFHNVLFQENITSDGSGDGN